MPTLRIPASLKVLATKGILSQENMLVTKIFLEILGICMNCVVVLCVFLMHLSVGASASNTSSASSSIDDRSPSQDEASGELLKIARSRSLYPVVELLNQGANQNARFSDAPRSSALHIAAQNGDIGLIYLLLSREANIEIEDDTGARPLHVAINCGHEIVVKFLLDHNASLDSPMKDGCVPLHLAADL